MNSQTYCNQVKSWCGSSATGPGRSIHQTGSHRREEVEPNQTSSRSHRREKVDPVRASRHDQNPPRHLGGYWSRGIANHASVQSISAVRPPPAVVRRRSLFSPPLSLIGLISSLLLAFAPLSAHSQSLWADKAGRSMFADKKARAVGDIITIVVQESNSASKDNSTSTAKKSGIDASISSFLYSPAASGMLTHNGKMPAMKMQSTSDFDGGGKINNSERINARISVRVVDVLPNGNLILEGTRQTSFSGEVQDAVLRGVVRQEDITANNTVFSFNVADASIKFVSKGTLSDSQRKGWFTRIWDKVAPF